MKKFPFSLLTQHNRINTQIPKLYSTEHEKLRYEQDIFKMTFEAVLFRIAANKAHWGQREHGSQSFE